MKLHITPTVYFVKSAKELVDTLFTPPRTASGTYKLRSNGILFFKPTGEPFAFLVANRHNERFFVTCSRQEDGKLRYMHGLSTSDEQYLGIADLSFSQDMALARRVWDESLPRLNSDTFLIWREQGECRYNLPPGDDLARHAAEAYGFVLNCPEHNKTRHTGPQFARIIAEYSDPQEPRNAAVIAHLATL